MRNSALNLLARREHSEQELKRKLLARGFDEQAIDQAVTQLQRENLQSDSRFAEAYVTMRARRGFGINRIRVELQERGVCETLAEQFLKAVDWLSVMTEVWEKKFHGKLPQDYAEKAKQIAFLQYRGFTMEQINQLFKQQR